MNFLKLFFYRKMDEISAEDEIREAFKVFDSVSWERAKAQQTAFFENLLILSVGKGFKT